MSLTALLNVGFVVGSAFRLLGVKAPPGVWQTSKKRKKRFPSMVRTARPQLVLLHGSLSFGRRTAVRNSLAETNRPGGSPGRPAKIDAERAR